MAGGSEGTLDRRIVMLIESFIVGKGGTAERIVKINDIALKDVRSYTLFLPDERWINAVARYHEDLAMLLSVVRNDLGLPSEFFVPDLWSTATKLPANEREEMLDMWLLGADLAH